MKCNKLGVNVVLSEVWAKGGEGGEALAKEVLKLIEMKNNFKFIYDDDDSIKDKIEKIAKTIYRADHVDYDFKAKKRN